MSLTICLWFDGQAEEAAEFYIEVFGNGSIGDVARYGPAASKASGQPEGMAMTVPFEVEGQRFLGLNGGPQFQFSLATSFIVERETQEEIDHLWERLTENGGEPSECGWLKDRFGVSWQIVPSLLPRVMTGDDPARKERFMGALMQMQKPIIAELEAAADGVAH